MIELDPIGVVETPFTSHAEAPRQGEAGAVRGTIRIDSAYAAGLSGITPGDRLDVVWYADRAARDRLVFDRNGRQGVFATRSQDRPNPICVTETYVREMQDGRLTVDGVDMLDGTPILDLKPPLRD